MKPKTIYGAAINLVGVWGPKKLSYAEDICEYYDRTGNFSVKKLGQHKDGYIITFASTSKEEVELWVSGVKAAMAMLRNWCNE